MTSLVAGCGAGPAPTGRAEVPAETRPGKLPLAGGFIPGEVLSFELSLLGVRGGRGAIAVGEPGQSSGRQVIIVRSHVASTGVARWFKEVRDDITSTLDFATGSPIHNQADILFGDRHTQLTTQFVWPRIKVEYDRWYCDHPDDRKRRRRYFSLPGDEIAHDLHSVLGAIRAWNPSPGQKVYFYAVSSSRIWGSTLTFVGSESVLTPLGVLPALRMDGVCARLTSRLQLDPKREPRTYSMWISDDRNRLPLRITAHTEYGDVMLELVDYQEPGRPHLSAQ